MTKIRLAHIEKQLMIAELELDGLKTHITMRKKKCLLYNTPFDKKIRKSLTSIRSARDILRNDNGSKQWTLTTRSNKANRHGLWDYQYRHPNWKCPFCYK